MLTASIVLLLLTGAACADIESSVRAERKVKHKSAHAAMSVDAAGQVEPQVEPVTLRRSDEEDSIGPNGASFDATNQEGSEKALLKHFDNNNDGCVDRAEFADRVIMPHIRKRHNEEIKLILPWLKVPKQVTLATMQDDGRHHAHWCPRKISAVNLHQSKRAKLTSDSDRGYACPPGCDPENKAMGQCMKVVKAILGFKPPRNLHEDFCEALFDVPRLGSAIKDQMPTNPPCVCEPSEVAKQFLKMALRAMRALQKNEKKRTKLVLPEDCGEGWLGSVQTYDAQIEKFNRQDVQQMFNQFPMAYYLFLQGAGNLKDLRELRDFVKESRNVTDIPVEVGVYQKGVDEASAVQYNDNAVCVVALSPQEGDGDWKISLSMKTVQNGFGPGKLLRGFEEVYESLNGTIKALVEGENCAKAKHVVFTGHSFGGALALLAYSDATKNWPSFQAGVITGASQTAYLITAGAPPIADRAFVEGLGTAGAIFQLASKGDPVVLQDALGRKDLNFVAEDLLDIYQPSALKWISCKGGGQDGCADLKQTYLPAGDKVHDSFQGYCETVEDSGSTMMT